MQFKCYIIYYFIRLLTTNSIIGATGSASIRLKLLQYLVHNFDESKLFIQYYVRKNIYVRINNSSTTTANFSNSQG